MRAARRIPPEAAPEQAAAPAGRLRDKPGHLVRRAQQRSDAIFAEEAREFGVTGPQYVVMFALAAHPGVDQARLAELLDFDRWTCAGILARLERRGLVRREVNAEDRRGRLLSLSPEGLALLAAMAPAVGRIRRRFLAPLDPAEQAAFLRLLGKLVGVRD